MGASPEVRSCADYRDGIGHLNTLNRATSAAGTQMAVFYAGPPPPTP